MNNFFHYFSGGKTLIDKSYDRCIQQGLLYAPIVGFSVGISTFRDLVNINGRLEHSVGLGVELFFAISKWHEVE